MYSRAIHLHNAVLSYEVQGPGSRALLMFHGASQDRTVFRQVPPGLSQTYRLYSFDLFFHGESTWNNERPISKSEWKEFMEEFCSVEQLDQFSILGYSIGCRFALATLEAFPKRVTSCYLVAPDGLAPSPWFNLATGTAVSRSVFHLCMNHPRGLNYLFSVAQRLGVVDPATLRFIGHQLDTAGKRERIFRAWTSFRLLRVERSALIRLVNSERIMFIVFLATRDQMVAMAPIKTFLKRLKSAHLQVIDSNHRRVLTEALKRIETR